MKIYPLFALITALIVLAGCEPVPVFETKQTYQLPRSNMGRVCAAQCIQTKLSCEQICETRNQNCQTNGRHEAKMKYLEYKMNQKAAGKPLDKTPNDFNNSSCNNVCDCTDTYNQCYQTCGGVVTTYQICTANCDKIKGPLRPLQ